MSLNFQFTLTIKANPTLETTSFINLPSSVLESCLTILDEPDFTSPLTFELKDEYKDIAACFSVLHFDASKDEVEVPLWFYKKFEKEQEITVTWKPLPKGTFCKLKSMDPTFKDMKFSKEFLEAQLRKNYTTINLNQVLELSYLSTILKFQILELEPEPAVNLVDCDLSVEIIDNSESVVMKTDFTKAYTELRMATHLDIEIKQSFYFKFLWNKDASFQLFLTKKKQELTSISLGYEDNFSKDNDMFVCVDKNLHSKILVETDSPFFKKNSWIHGCITSVSDVKANLKINVADVNPDFQPDLSLDTVACPHCQKGIPKQNFELHSLRCKLDFKKCELCGLSYSKVALNTHWHCQKCPFYGDNEIQVLHDRFYHAPSKCSCGLEFQGSVDLSRHSYFYCSLRLIRCRFCYNSVPYNTEAADYTDKLNGLNDHESYCGSRTITCQKCNKHVQIKKVKIHHQLHDFDKQRLPLPFNKCKNKNCVNPKEDPNLDDFNLELCNGCRKLFPFYIAPFDKKDFTKRLTQVYFQQLTLGCTSPNCKNALCLTSSNEVLSPNEAVIKLVPYIKQAFDTKAKQYHLCLDSARDEKFLQLDTLVKKLDTQKFKVEWCIQALEENGYQVEKAKVWLKLNAPYEKLI